jgi:hypothetical protein
VADRAPERVTNDLGISGKTGAHRGFGCTCCDGRLTAATG